MANIPPFFLDCVVAIGVTVDGGKKRWIASGFFLGKLDKVIDEHQVVYQVYLVTNRHVFEGLKTAHIRCNPKDDQPAREYTLNLTDAAGKKTWHCPPDPSIDIAITLINANLLRDHGMKVSFFQNDEHIADCAKLRDLTVTEGTNVFALGFPMGLIGGDRSYVVVRSGVVARIGDCLAGKNAEFLIDAFTFPGNSGGPVVTRPEVGSITGTKPVKVAQLIGVVKGFVPYRDVAVSQQTGRPRVTFEENSGLTAVVPVDHVLTAIGEHEKGLQ